MLSDMVKQFILCLLLLMLLTQSVLAGIVETPFELDNNALTKVEHHNIDHHCIYNDSVHGFDKNNLIDFEMKVHQCHHHTSLFFLFDYSKLSVSFYPDKVFFKSHSYFNSYILEPPFKPPIIL